MKPRTQRSPITTEIACGDGCPAMLEFHYDRCGDLADCPDTCPECGREIDVDDITRAAEQREEDLCEAAERYYEMRADERRGK